MLSLLQILIYKHVGLVIRVRIEEGEWASSRLLKPNKLNDNNNELYTDGFLYKIYNSNSYSEHVASSPGPGEGCTDQTELRSKVRVFAYPVPSPSVYELLPCLEQLTAKYLREIHLFKSPIKVLSRHQFRSDGDPLPSTTVYPVVESIAKVEVDTSCLPTPHQEYRSP